MDKITVIVTTYLESSKKYLDLCMRSIENLNYEQDKLNIIIVARQSYMPQYHNATTIAPISDQYYPAEGINLAMKRAWPDSKHFFILNDDCICTKNALINLVEAIGDQDLMANATSPCDNGLVYNLAFAYKKADGEFHRVIGHQFQYEEFEPNMKELMNAEALYSRGFVCMPYLCIFATLIPRKVYEAIGEWDEKFKCGQDDLDYSWRAQRAGFQTVAILDSLVWHFSGVTAASTLNLDIRKQNVRYFKSKWGVMPPGIPPEFINE